MFTCSIPTHIPTDTEAWQKATQRQSKAPTQCGASRRGVVSFHNKLIPAGVMSCWHIATPWKSEHTGSWPHNTIANVRDQTGGATTGRVDAGRSKQWQCTGLWLWAPDLTDSCLHCETLEYCCWYSCGWRAITLHALGIVGYYLELIQCEL